MIFDGADVKWSYISIVSYSTILSDFYQTITILIVIAIISILLTMQAKTLAATSEELTVSSEQTSSASKEVARTIDEIANGAGDQAKDIETSASHVDGMGNLIEKELINMNELNSAAEDIEKRKDEGYKIIKELIDKTEANKEISEKVYEVVVTTNNNVDKIEVASLMIENIAT